MKIGGIEIGRRVSTTRGGMRSLASKAARMDALATGIDETLQKGIVDPEALAEQLRELQELREQNEGLAGLVDTPEGLAYLDVLRGIERRMTERLPLTIVMRSKRALPQALEILMLRSQIEGIEKMSAVTKGPVRRALGRMQHWLHKKGVPNGTV